MKKKHLICMVIYFLVVGVIIFGTDNLETIRTALEYVKCGNSKGIPKPIPMLTSWVFTILLVATPIVLIVFSIITLAKSTVAGNPDEMTKARNKLFKKLIGCALAFLVVALSRYVLLTATTGNNPDKDTITSCISCYLFNSCQNDRDTNKDINKTVEKKTRIYQPVCKVV